MQQTSIYALFLCTLMAASSEINCTHKRKRTKNISSILTLTTASQLPAEKKNIPHILSSAPIKRLPLSAHAIIISYILPRLYAVPLSISNGDKEIAEYSITTPIICHTNGAAHIYTINVSDFKQAVCTHMQSKKRNYILKKSVTTIWDSGPSKETTHIQTAFLNDSSEIPLCSAPTIDPSATHTISPVKAIYTPEWEQLVLKELPLEEQQKYASALYIQ